MTLAEALDMLDELDDDAVVYASPPWSESADAKIGPLAEDLSVPAEMKAAGFDYFLDVVTAREVLEVFGDSPPTRDEKLRLLLYYGENDAFPQWVYQR